VHVAKVSRRFFRCNTLTLPDSYHTSCSPHSLTHRRTPPTARHTPMSKTLPQPPQRSRHSIWISIVAVAARQLKQLALIGKSNTREVCSSVLEDYRPHRTGLKNQYICLSTMAARHAAPVAAGRAPPALPACAERTRAHAGRRPAAPRPSALPRAENAAHHFYSRLLRTHRQRLEHLVSSGATSAADLQPVVSELR
jgi:hypothetical protein